jgi:hypothetical protein
VGNLWYCSDKVVPRGGSYLIHRKRAEPMPIHSAHILIKK